MDQEEQQIEKARLAETLRQVRQQIGISEHMSDQHRHLLQATMKDYWRAGGTSSTDEAQIIETMNRQRALSSHVHQTVAQLRKMQKSPYFGRIDFVEAGFYQAETIYIGIGSLTDLETGEFIIYDWRAPVSGMFYDYGRGHASYHCPAGTITGMIKLKRQYKIADGQIEYMFDSDLKIDDEILQQLLGKSADDKMHTIVNSIQREQNQIIRNQTHKVLFVEGPAGSGKTSVALHRIAFLLYQDREKLTAQNVLILSPNHVFGDYISNVLPEIGEEHVLQMTFQDYVSRSTAQIPLQCEARTAYLDRMLAVNPSRKRAANIRFKSSNRFSQVLSRYLDWLASDWINEHPTLAVKGETIFSKDEWRHYYAGSFCMMPPVLRLEKIRAILQNRMRDLVHAVRQDKIAKLVAAGEEVNEKVIKALARVQARDELRPITDQIEQLTTLDIVSEFKSLFKDDKLYRKTGTSIPDEWQIIKTQTLGAINQGLLFYEDIPAFLYFQGVLQGFPVQTDIKHVVIDEAQDYTALHYKILAQLFPQSSWTIVGDPVQLVQPFLESASFKEAGYILDREQTLLFRLTKSYRSTREIQAFCQALLLGTKKVQSVNRPGPLPAIIKTESPQALVLAIAETVQSIQAQGWRSIGLITKNAAQAKAAHQMLGDSVKSILVTKEEDEFHRGLVIIPSYLAKGLEFDAVMILNADSANYSHEQDCHILYTICTRALHRLYLYYTDTLSPFIAQISKDLYQTEKL